MTGQIHPQHQPKWHTLPFRPSASRQLSGRTRVAVALAVSALAATLFNRVQDRLGHNTTLAADHASVIVRLEGSLGLHIEPHATQWLAAHPPLALCASAFYPAVLVLPWLVIALVALRDVELCRRALTSLFVLSLVALIPFWLFPTAPPRLAETGVVDIVQNFPVFGGDGRGAARLVDLDASMPSLHVAWSWWCAAVLRRLASTRRVASAATWPLPLVVALDVVFTGNHYLADVVAGVLLASGCNALLLGGVRRTRV